jgi:hypothetical protein
MLSIMRKLSMKPVLVVMMVYCLPSCSGQEGGRGEEKDHANSLVLDYFDAIPDIIDGCGEFYTYDSVDYETGRCLFISNLKDVAMVRINGSIITLDLESTESHASPDEMTTSFFANDTCMVFLTTRISSRYDEGSFRTGRLKVICGKSNAVIFVHGESGC